VLTFKNGRREIKEVTDHCRNKHLCPDCSRYQYAKLQKAIESLLDWWQSLGRSVYTQTLTLPNRNKPLIYKHEDLGKVWGAVNKDKAFGKLKKKYGLAQYLKILEDSLKLVGSFPHYHLTWFFDSDLPEEQMVEFCDAIAELWEKKATAKGIRGTQAARQWRGPIRESNRSYSRYLTKHGYYDLSFDPLKAKPNQGLKPHEFLRVLVATGDYQYLKVWEEYELATRGKHRVVLSKRFQWGP
jgi:hypothetical protein